MDAKLGRMLVNPPTRLLNPLVTWSCKIKYLNYHSAYGHRTWEDGHHERFLLIRASDKNKAGSG